MGKFLSACASLDLSVNPSGSPSFTPSPLAENPSKFPSIIMGENTVNYLHKLPVKIPTAHSSSVMSAIAPICASSVLSVDPSDDEHQEIPDEFPGTNHREKFPAKITTKIPDNVTPTLCKVKFPEKTLEILMGDISW